MGDDNNLLERVLASSPSKFALFTSNAEQFKFQALLSCVSVDSSGHPTLVRHGYRVDHEYFYPASSIKLCVVVAALYKLQHLKKLLGLDISLTTPLAFYPLLEGGPLVDDDLSNLCDGMINLSHEIRKTLLVSDNVAYNRLYAFTGQRYINEKISVSPFLFPSSLPSPLEIPTADKLPAFPAPLSAVLLHFLASVLHKQMSDHEV
ncbi:hypothetical protein L7F22_056678 [Adiantum nelumboides]|nr:hypothetical protein [Adiantum nelumboides]